MAASGDIVDRIKHDHEELEEAYAKYKAAHESGNEQEAGKWFNQFVWEISRHSVSEEMVLYPLLDSLPSPRGRDLANQSRQEHQHTKEMLEKLMAIDDPAEFATTMDAMMTDLRQHIRKEEAEDLKIVESQLSDKDRKAAGAKFQLGKKLAPTRPHAGVPNNQIALESALGLLLKPVDKLKDAFTPFPIST